MRIDATLALAASLTLLGCTQKGSLGVPTTLAQQDIAVAVTGGKLDLLFMVDNSPSMAAMQAQLQANIGTLMASLSGANNGGVIDLHVGVVTSDYGAGAVANSGCEASPGGQKGLLQGIGAAADSSCQAPTGSRYVSYQVASDGTVTSNLPGGNDLTHLVSTFTCMASVGASGCGFEHQLESVYAALHNTDENAGFLRDDAALSIVFLTNEDDASAPPTVDFFNPDPSKVAQYGAYTTYRQTHFGVSCGGMPSPEDSSDGPLTGCVPTPNPDNDDSAEYDVSRYTSFFTQPKSLGGIKDNPLQVSLIEIAGVPTPFSTLLAMTNTGNGSTTPPSTSASYVPCALPGQNCIVALQHECQNDAEPAFFADPPVRLDTVVQAATLHQSIPICGDDLSQAPDYTTGMTQMGALMSSQLTGGCLYQALVNPSTPSCTVTYTSTSGITTTLEPCAGTQGACWSIADDVQCPAVNDPSTDMLVQQRLVVTGLPSNAGVTATCRVYTTQN